MIAPPARYSAVCALVLGGLVWLAGEGTRLGLLPALVLLPLAAGPAWIGMAYPAAIRKAQAKAILQDGAAPWWAPFLGGALWRQGLAVPLALVSAWSMGWMVMAQGWVGLGWIAAAAALLWPVAALVSRQTGALKPYAKLRPVLLAAPPVAAALLTLAWVLVAGLGSLGEGTLAQRIAAEPRYEGSSALLAWAVDAMGIANGARAWALSWAEGQVGPAALLWRAAATFGQFWLIAGVFAAGLLPRAEARRILRASAADEPPLIGPSRAALAGCLGTVLLAALASGLAEAEAWATARQHPQAMAKVDAFAVPDGPGAEPRLPSGPDRPPETLMPGLLTPSALRRIVEAEQIGELACPVGTLASLETIDRGLHNLLAQRREEVETAARAGFEAVRARVPVFLDSYYGLTAEYLRTFHLVAGQAETFLEHEMADALAVSGAFDPFRSAVAALDAPLPTQALAARSRLLVDCGFLPADGLVLTVTAEAPESLLRPAPDAETMSFRTRLMGGAGTAAGGLAGVVAGKLIAKLLAKEAFGLAAEAAGKLALGKAAGGLGGVAAGAGAGALAGSVLPGLGTTVGAVVGGVVGGLALGVAADYALLKLEEAVSRDDFEAQVLAAIDEAEAEFLERLEQPK